MHALTCVFVFFYAVATTSPLAISKAFAECIYESTSACTAQNARGPECTRARQRRMRERQRRAQRRAQPSVNRPPYMLE
eukprot:2340038-Pyramimonas_sp.AAC.1